MTLYLVLLAEFAGALVASLLLCGLWMRVAFKDAPDGGRKMQLAPVPTSGGVGIAAATLLAFAGVLVVAYYTGSGVPIWIPAYAIPIGGVAMMVIGLADDRIQIDAKIKLALMLLVTVAMTAGGIKIGWLWVDLTGFMPAVAAQILTAALCTAWLIVIINAVNFMDGANGLAMSMSAIAALGLAVCGFLAGSGLTLYLSLALVGALCGFLVWNVSGKLYAGDAGALFVGLMLGGLSIGVIELRRDWLFVPPTLLLPFLSDVLLTLAWRARHGKPLFSAHRDHAYQIAMKAGMKHWQVAAVHAFWAFNALLFGVAGAVIGGWAPLAAFLTLLLVSVLVHMRVRSHGVKAGLVGADVA